jgi:hypothetical protein
MRKDTILDDVEESIDFILLEDASKNIMHCSGRHTWYPMFTDSFWIHYYRNRHINLKSTRL